MRINYWLLVDRTSACVEVESYLLTCRNFNSGLVTTCATIFDNAIKYHELHSPPIGSIESCDCCRSCNIHTKFVFCNSNRRNECLFYNLELILFFKNIPVSETVTHTINCSFLNCQYIVYKVNVNSIETILLNYTITIAIKSNTRSSCTTSKTTIPILL